ncbi:MAG: hypothetical protein GC192_16945 [Bacteroidetes bacterium]|nr:hypothetical protein [Bacteroidota bacterium]
MKLLALLLCIVDAGMTFLSGVMAMMSPMAMDAPGSEKSKALWAFVYLMIASPVAFLVTDIVAWVQFGKGRYKTSIYWALSGFMPLILAFISLLFSGK